MTARNVLTASAAAVLCLVLLAAGCAPSAREPLGTEAFELRLKFTPEDTASYRLVTEASRSVTYEGSLANETSLKGGQTGDEVEITFDQRTQSINENGNAVTEITFKALKYLAKEKDKVVLDFDSSREKDQGNPLAKLVGQSYKIELTSAGRVAGVTNLQQAQAAVRGSSPAHRRAAALLQPDVIKRRHSIPALPPADRQPIRTSDEWSSLRTLSHGMMGTKSYERIYAAKEVQNENGQEIALVEMNAIPTAETAEQLHKEQPSNIFEKMFDNIETYTGRLKLNLATGRVEQYWEKLVSEWTIVDPAAKATDQKDPDALKMTAIRSYSLERID